MVALIFLLGVRKNLIDTGLRDFIQNFLLNGLVVSFTLFFLFFKKFSENGGYLFNVV